MKAEPGRVRCLGRAGERVRKTRLAEVGCSCEKFPLTLVARFSDPFSACEILAFLLSVKVKDSSRMAEQQTQRRYDTSVHDFVRVCLSCSSFPFCRSLYRCASSVHVGMCWVWIELQDPHPGAFIMLYHV